MLDWEMAAIGPRELDVSWMVFAHSVFESITGVMGMPGMPHFLHEDDLKAEYERITGVTLGDLQLVPRLQRRPVVHRLHAHRCPADPLR